MGRYDPFAYETKPSTDRVKKWRVNNKDAFKAQKRKHTKNKQLASVGTFDFETTPFDETAEGQQPVIPFLVCVVLDNDRWHLWREQGEELYSFLDRFMEKLRTIQTKCILYAHNGGRFDMRFIQAYLRGEVSTKGSAIMRVDVSEKVQLRDSLHIIPIPLRAYKKQEIPYAWFADTEREQHKQDIIDYCYLDCDYSLDIIKDFWKRYGDKISIGQAAFSGIRKTIDKITFLTEHQDGLIRGLDTNYYHKETYGKQIREGYFKGGRCECLEGKGKFHGRYRLYDVNSMYPYVMAHYRHPIGGGFTHHVGPPNDNTAFIQLWCTNDGAFLKYDEDKLSGETRRGEFFVTIHEYKMALELGLIRDVEIYECIDVDEWATFDDFILPLYKERQETKEKMKAWKESGREQVGLDWDKLVRDDLFAKLLMNNSYGKFAQNPRRFTEQHFFDIDEEIPFPVDLTSFILECERPFKVAYRTMKPKWNEEAKSYDPRTGKDRLRFYNVATGASITGAARSVLLHALYYAIDPIYCDTDSVICREMGHNIPLDETRLGAWKLECELDNPIIAGKKLYGYTTDKGKVRVRSKGMPGLSLDDIETIVDGDKVRKKNKGVNINVFGIQQYIIRELTATAKKGPSLFKRLQNARTQLKVA